MRLFVKKDRQHLLTSIENRMFDLFLKSLGANMRELLETDLMSLKRVRRFPTELQIDLKGASAFRMYYAKTDWPDFSICGLRSNRAFFCELSIVGNDSLVISHTRLIDSRISIENLEVRTYNVGPQLSDRVASDFPFFPQVKEQYGVRQVELGEVFIQDFNWRTNHRLEALASALVQFPCTVSSQFSYYGLLPFIKVFPICDRPVFVIADIGNLFYYLYIEVEEPETGLRLRRYDELEFSSFGCALDVAMTALSNINEDADG